MVSLQCRRFLQAHERFCSRKKGRGRGRGRGERRDFFPSFPSPVSFFRPSNYPIFLCHKIKGGGYNNTNMNKQL